MSSITRQPSIRLQYMAVFYNRQRLHHALGYRRWEEFERQEAGT